MSESERIVLKDKREQMLRLVTKGFYRELVRYGVDPDEVLTVANNLLGHISIEPPAIASVRGTEAQLNLSLVEDRWEGEGRLSVLGVDLRPLDAYDVPQVAAWLRDPEAHASFVPQFPTELGALERYLMTPGRSYLAIMAGGNHVGIIGADNVDSANAKLEMKKLIGEHNQRGLGVGTRATFAFLYYAFMLLDAYKVYVHFHDINIRNLNLNKRLGFELEGLLLEDVQRPDGRVDLVRMCLLKPAWLHRFAAEMSVTERR